ncbi:hypothetical protein [Salipiger mucosus]|uniref:Uncharacterized protein n=1 Tax=Salipiger mucosus DSM 16094 TaxID=1123237 RepID=S9QWS9_9RHOB|nr:hypothetical protein [Salipiger mucosus]EPX84058.1 hypothetical protein Salmuc_01833 [Salipiger mucosus DSM 16094]
MTSSVALSNAEVIDQAKSVFNCSQRELARILMHSKDQVYRWKTNQSRMPADVRARLETLISHVQSGSGVNTIMLSLSHRSPDEGATQMQEFFDEMASKHELFEEIMPFGFDVRELTATLKEFGFFVPDDALPTDRQKTHQVRNIFSAFLNSLDILHQWMETFLVDKSERSALDCESVLAAKGKLQGHIIKLAIAKMDIDSVNLHFLDRSIFSEKKRDTLSAVNSDIKSFLEAYRGEGYALMRNPFRITEADNDSLFFEMDSAENASEHDITQYFTLAQRTILREVRALRKIMEPGGR